MGGIDRRVSLHRGVSVRIELEDMEMALEPTDDDVGRLAPTAAADPHRLVAEFVVSRRRPTLLTMYPPDATGFDRMTSWITASEGSFVSLTESR